MANKINVSLVLDTSEFSRSIRGVENSLKRFGQNLSGIGSQLTQSLTIPLGLAGVAAVNSFAQIEKLTKGMVAMTGSTEAAESELKKLREVAKLPGLGLQEAIKGSINLQAVKLSAIEARSVLLGFGKALSVTGGGKNELDRIQVQLTQMISKNKLLAEDYKVIQSLLPLMGDAMERTFGTRNIEKIRATGISAKDFVLQISQGLNTLPQVQNVTGGLANAFENFGDTLTIVGTQFGKSINEALNLEGILASLSTRLQAAADWFSELSKPMQKFLIISTAIAVALGPVLIIIGKLSGVMALALNGVRALAGGLALLTSPIGLIVAAIAAVAAGIVYAYKNFEGFRRVVDAVGAALAVAFKAIGAAFGALWDRIKVFASGAIAAVVRVGNILIEKIKPWLPLIGKVLGAMLKITGTIVGGIISHFVGMVNSVTNLFFEMGAVIKEVIGGIANSFQLLKAGEFKKAFQAIADTPTVFQAFKRVGVAAADGYAQGFIGVQDTIKEMGEAFKQELEATNKTFRRIGRSSTDAISDAFSPSTESPGTSEGDGKKKKIKSFAAVALPGFQALGGAVDRLNKGLGPLFDTANQVVKPLETAGNTHTLFALLSDGVNSFRADAFVSKAKQVADVMDTMGKKADENFLIVQKAAAERLAIARQYIDEFNKGLTNIVNTGLNDLIVGFAESLGSLSESGNGIQNIFGSILNTIAGVLEQLGKLAIAAGVATAGIKAALKTLSPFAAIAGGIALVALSKLVKTKAASLASFAEGGLAYGPTLALVGDNPGASRDPEVIAPFSKLEKLMSGGAGGETRLTGQFQIRGADLLLAIDRAKQQRSRIR